MDVASLCFFATEIEKIQRDIIVSLREEIFGVSPDGSCNAACKYKLQECRISEVFTEKRKL